MYPCHNNMIVNFPNTLEFTMFTLPSQPNRKTIIKNEKKNCCKTIIRTLRRYRVQKNVTDLNHFLYFSIKFKYLRSFKISNIKIIYVLKYFHYKYR